MIPFVYNSEPAIVKHDVLITMNGNLPCKCIYFKQNNDKTFTISIDRTKITELDSEANLDIQLMDKFNGLKINYKLTININFIRQQLEKTTSLPKPPLAITNQTIPEVIQEVIEEESAEVEEDVSEDGVYADDTSISPSIAVRAQPSPWQNKADPKLIAQLWK
jgi:hypothetical protein